jgi:hypothetical protein
MDPNPDYDASDEIEYFFSWLAPSFARRPAAPRVSADVVGPPHWMQR